MGALVNVPMTGGIDQKSAVSSVPLGRLLKGENAGVPKIGSYAKRYGTTQLSRTLQDGSTLAAGATLAARGAELDALERGRLLAYSPNAARWTPADQLPEWTAKQVSIAQGAGANVDPDVARVPGFLLCTWGADGATAGANQKIYAQIVDETTGALVLPPTELTAGIAVGLNPKAIGIGTTFIVVWKEAGLIVARRCPTTTLPLAFAAKQTLRSDAATSGGIYDACPVVGAVRYCIAYQNSSAGTNLLTIAQFDAANTQFAVATPTDATTSAFQAVGVYVSATVAWVAFAWDDGVHNRIRATVRSADLGSQTTAPTEISSTLGADNTFAISIVELDDGEAQVAWRREATNQTNAMTVNTALLERVNSRRALYRGQLASRLLLFGGKTWAWVGFSLAVSVTSGTDWQGTMYLVDMLSDDYTSTGPTIPRPVACVGPRQSYGPGAARNQSSLSGVVVDAAGLYHAMGTLGRSRISGATGTQPSARLTSVDLQLSLVAGDRQSVEATGALYLSGGIPSWFDGVRVAEVGFLAYPYAEATSNNAGGSLTSSATYGYAITFLQWDNLGNVHRSAPFFVSRTLGGADNRVVLTISWYNLTTRQDAANSLGKVAVEIHRTAANGATFRRLTAEVAVPSGLAASSAGTMQNDPASYTSTYTDQAADSALSGQPLLYTSGNVLDNVNPPSSRVVVRHRGRIFFGACANRREVWASKRILPSEAPGFNEGLVLTSSFDVVALASLDDKLVLFGEDQIAYITGDGPTDDGGNNDWSDPIPIIGTVGCIEPRSLVVTPLGLLFQSHVGISLLSRGLEVVPQFGMAVEDELALYPVVTSAVLHATATEIRFACQSASGQTGRELRYDHRAQQWFTANYNENGALNAPMQGALNSREIYTWISANGRVYQENGASYLDDGRYVAMTLEFARLQASGQLGYQAVHHVVVDAERKTDHDLTVSVAVDGSAYGESASYRSDTIAALTTELLDYHLRQQKNRSVQVKIADATPTGPGASVGTGQGYILSALAFEGEPIEGRYRNLAPGAKA